MIINLWLVRFENDEVEKGYTWLKTKYKTVKRQVIPVSIGAAATSVFYTAQGLYTVRDLCKVGANKVMDLSITLDQKAVESASARAPELLEEMSTREQLINRINEICGKEEN